jgi:hypothetical protein
VQKVKKYRNECSWPGTGRVKQAKRSETRGLVEFRAPKIEDAVRADVIFLARLSLPSRHSRRVARQDRGRCDRRLYDCKSADDGRVTVTRVSVGKNGLVPPM